MKIAELSDEVVLRRVVSADDVARWRGGFVGAYQTVFTGFPYFERWYPSEAEGVFRKLVAAHENVTLIATRGETQVVAFGVAIPLAEKPAVATILTGLVPV